MMTYGSFSVLSKREIVSLLLTAQIKKNEKLQDYVSDLSKTLNRESGSRVIRGLSFVILGFLLQLFSVILSNWPKGWMP